MRVCWIVEAGKAIKKVYRYGQTLWVPLPSKFVKAHGIKHSDFVEVYFNDLLHVKTIDKKNLQRKLEEAQKLFEEEEKLKT